MTYTFTAVIDIIGINPFVFVPPHVLQSILNDAESTKTPIQVKGIINKIAYKQTLVKYAGEWRLYINTTMLKKSPTQVGKSIVISIAYDPEDRSIPLHPKLSAALQLNKKASKVFELCTPSLQKEINRYISTLKTAESINNNVKKAINFLLGKEKFVGRPPIKNK